MHGCHEELRELLERIGPGSRDQVIMLGDLVNNGPDSHRSLALAREVNAVCLLGNHERRLLLHRRTGNQKLLKKIDRKTIQQLTAEDWSHLEKMVLTHHLPDLETVCVHGGFLPDRRWEAQAAETVTRIQVVDEKGKARKRAASPKSPHWSELWEGPPFVIYGHTPRAQYKRLKWSIGIDTACVQGGMLTAFVLPEEKIVQVAAKRPYI